MQVFLLEIGKHGDHQVVPSLNSRGARIELRRPEAIEIWSSADDPGRKLAIRVVVVVAGEGHLLEVVLTLQAGCRLANLLHRRQEQPDEHRDDGEDHQQFDQR